MMLLSGAAYDLKLYSKRINPDWVQRGKWMPCAAWKWLGQKRVCSASVLDDPARFAKDYSDDYVVTKALHDVIQQASVIVGHNVDAFDLKEINARCIAHGLDPLPKALTVDTLKLARSRFRFPSNDLRNLARFLKLNTSKGKSPMWDLVSSGDEKEIKRCIKYNKADVVVLEELYLMLRGWQTGLRASPQRHNQSKELTLSCSVCGHWDMQSRGRGFSKALEYRRFVCNRLTGGCGSWSRV